MPARNLIRIGTRGSALAVTQTRWVAGLLEAAGVVVELRTITTRGDAGARIPGVGPAGDGVFVRELEQALLAGEIDAAVHSLKDMPTAETPGLTLSCVPERETPFDALVVRGGGTLAGLPAGAVVGTSSVRRVVQLKWLRPDLVVKPVRGNVDTRLRRLDAGDYDALVLAAAGLRRLGLGDRCGELLRPGDYWPAVGQGALAVQTRAHDTRVRATLAPLDHPATHVAVLAERACLAALAGGCLVPIGGWARLDGTGRLGLGGCVVEQNGKTVRRIVAEEWADAGDVPAGGGDSAPAAAVALGTRVAERLRNQGADAMLARMRSRAAAENG
jgi:hydroxymethylbilane synthase